MDCTTRRVALFVAALGISAALAPSAGAAPKARKSTAPATTAESTCRGANLFHCGPITSGDDYLGTDPDPFIRLMIQRDLGVKYGGAP